MRIVIFPEAGAFLDRAQAALEQNEEENHLILGICERMRSHPERVNVQPYLATVEARGEIVLGVMMTPPFPMVLARTGSLCREAFPLLANALRQSEWRVSEINGPEELSSEFANFWASKIGVQKQVGRQQRLYILRQVNFPKGVPGDLRKAVVDDMSVVQAWGGAFSEELSDQMGMDSAQFKRVIRNQVADGNVYLWDDDGPVSMAMKNRPSRNGAAVSYVYTPPPKRRRGYASACVAGLSQELLSAGYKFCALYTDLHNPTSNHIYQQVGYRSVSDFTSYTFS